MTLSFWAHISIFSYAFALHRCVVSVYIPDSTYRHKCPVNQSVNAVEYLIRAFNENKLITHCSIKTLGLLFKDIKTIPKQEKLNYFQRLPSSFGYFLRLEVPKGTLYL